MKETHVIVTEPPHDAVKPAKAERESRRLDPQVSNSSQKSSTIGKLFHKSKSSSSLSSQSSFKSFSQKLFPSNKSSSSLQDHNSEKENPKLKRFFKNVVKHHKHHHRKHHHQGDGQANGAVYERPAQPKTKPEPTPDIISKYGIPGKVVGQGAGGSVSIVEKPDSGEIFAVKMFTSRPDRELLYDYKKRVRTEFSIGSQLKQENIIRTYDLIEEGPACLIIMEYCPFDFFTIVMSGLMTKYEVYCYFRQIANGVAFLHKSGYAHRDLKLDNCVVNNQGSLKLIDFGSAILYRSGQGDLFKTRGVVGSDPYLAPEVLGMKAYDPCPTDVWSTAIIFCCMVIKRFPWKLPKMSDQSYRLFVMDPNDEDEEMKTRTKGPYRLLRLLPHHSRLLISRMLELDPTKRFTMEQVVQDDFMREIEVCSTDEAGEFHPAQNHKHHLVTEEDLLKIEEEKKKEKSKRDNESTI